MGNNYVFLLGLALLSLSHGKPGLAQKLSHVQGEILLQLQESDTPQTLFKELTLPRQGAPALNVGRRLHTPMPVWTIHFDHTRIDEYELLRRLREHPRVVAAQFNHFIEPRSTIPNDPQFNKQWQYLNTGQSGGAPGVDLDMELAWDYSTGGVTATGDRIVVCIIDDGVDINHEDLKSNLWVNQAEIPGNGLDDDGNGYFDDYLGWNIYSQDDDIDVDIYHGSPIAGIIGAKGNNGIGVSGINWDVQLMIVVGGGGRESEVLEAYAYPWAQRRRYNQTKGREGAFVTVVNASWGIDGVKPVEFPLWCAMYDTLGAQGILSVAATTNKNVNVDEVGDMPTGCGSPFLIGVTNVDHRGRKVTAAGYGPASIDLGAFGENTWTTATGNSYGPFEGTSAAAPHATGAVALLYAIPCPTLMAVAQSDPAAAALQVRDYVLRGVVPDPTLAETTAAGGRLNVFNSMKLLADDCGACPPPTSIEAVDIDADAVSLVWNSNDSIRRIDLRWRAIGASAWNNLVDVNSPVRLLGLNPCSAYEFQISGYCREDSLDYGPPVIFHTDGCCVLPQRFRLSSVSVRSAVVEWNNVLAAQNYQIRFRKTSEADWRSAVYPSGIAFLNNLEPCAAYEVQIRTICQVESTDFGHTLFFTTLGCGPCLDRQYCLPTNIDASAEWIAEVIVNALENESGNDGGYGNFTFLPATQLKTGSAYPILLRPGYTGESFFEYFQVWIDFNQDGRFDPSELVFDPGGASRSAVSGNVTIPENAPLGNTRLRVAMKFLEPGGPCNYIDRPFGEIEDYCVTIVAEEQHCESAANIVAVRIENTKARLRWDEQNNASSFLLRYRKADERLWQLLTAPSNEVELERLSPCAEYVAQVKSICGANPGLFSTAFSFRTDCSTNVDTPSGNVVSISVFPNPFRHELYIELSLFQAEPHLDIALYDARGRLMRRYDKAAGAGDNRFEMPWRELSAGVYWLKLTLANREPIVRRVLKTNDQ
jgi:serine protease